MQLADVPAGAGSSLEAGWREHQPPEKNALDLRLFTPRTAGPPCHRLGGGYEETKLDGELAWLLESD
jgi:hypothetical protein